MEGVREKGDEQNFGEIVALGENRTNRGSACHSNTFVSNAIGVNLAMKRHRLTVKIPSSDPSRRLFDVSCSLSLSMIGLSTVRCRYGRRSKDKRARRPARTTGQPKYRRGSIYRRMRCRRPLSNSTPMSRRSLRVQGGQGSSSVELNNWK